MIVEVVLSTLLSGFVGFVWYSPGVFGKTWFQATFPTKKISEAEFSQTVFLSSLASHAVMSILLAVTLKSFFAVSTLTEGLQAVAYLAGIMVCSQVCHHGYDRRPPVACLIHHGYDIVCMLIMTLIILCFN